MRRAKRLPFKEPRVARVILILTTDCHSKSHDACRSFPLEVRLSLPNTPNGADENFRWSVGALGFAHAAENWGRQHRSSPCKAGNTGLADLAPDERLTLTKKDSHTGRVAR